MEEMVVRKNIATGVSFTWEQGKSIVSSPYSAVVLIRTSGYFTTEAALHINHESERLFVFGKPSTIFCDWGDMSGYESGARTESTKWLLDKRELLDKFHILVKSKIVAMGVAVANVAVGGLLHATSERAVFERELRAATAMGR